MTQHRITTESAATKDGILFVSSTPEGGEPELAGDTAYAELVAETIKLVARTDDEPKIRVVLSKVCIEVQKQPHKTVAIVYRQGSAIVKSLQRMARKLGRQNETKIGQEQSTPDRL
jgi:hypothetical protein